MKSVLKLRRSIAGVLAAGALMIGVAGAVGAGIALTASPATAGPAEDCAAVRARDHQIYLNLIASLPPGAPIPPEYINPCLTAPSTTATVAPTTTVGLPGAQAPGGGPNVGANAPTNFPSYNGTPIVPVPGAALPGQPNTPTAPSIDNPAGVPVPTTTSGPAPTTPQPAGSTAPTAVPDRGPGPVPSGTPNTVPGQSESNPTVTPSGLSDDDGRDRYLELVLVGAAAFTAGGIGVRGRRSPFGPRIPLGGRTPESILSQTVGTLASPLMQYAKGGQSKITVTEPGGGRRTFFLIHDATSSHEAEIPVDVPPGGHMSVNPDGSVTVFDADGNPVSVVAAPWAYDADGNPVPTDYEVRDGRLIQKVYADEATAYPILADPPDKKVKAPASVASKQVTKSSNTPSKPNSMTSRTSPQKPQSGGNTNSGNTSGGNKPAPNSMTPRTSPQKPQNSGNTSGGNTSGGNTSAPNSMTSRTSPQKPQNSGNTSGDNTSGGNTSAPNSMTSRTSPQKPQNSGNTNTGNTSGATTSKPNSMTPRTTPQKPPTTGLWDSAWGFGESVVDTAVESVETLGDAWRNFLVVPVNNAAVDPFGLHPGLRAEPSPEHSPAEITIAAANIVALIFPGVSAGGRVGVTAVREAVEAVLERGGSVAEAEAVGRSVAAGLGPADYTAIGRYTGVDSMTLNSALRTPSGLTPELAAEADALSSALSKLPNFEGDVYRGVVLPERVIARYEPGTIVEEKAFTSATTDLLEAFPGNVRFSIESRTGKEISEFSAMAEEAEVLFDQFTSFEVLARTVNSTTGVTEILMREVVK
ncbi:ADP-ribosyltransferase [Rhodococcus qingshengii]|uniref:ADP-ribosyltransferase n=1 Tax=Rhodococcus qingshengii TaxID=334542 RepID=UPI0036677D6E